MSDAEALPPPPPWLTPLQQGFARLLQTPLESQGGTLHSRSDLRDLQTTLASTPHATAGLRLYHEQYWMRLYTAMQGEIPRFAQVVGYWNFNSLATLHLREAPPKAADLARCADGFAGRVLALLDPLTTGGASPDRRPLNSLVAKKEVWEAALQKIPAPLDLARQALQMDEAVRQSFVAPYVEPWRPTPAELANLETKKIRFSPSFRLLREDWALAERGRLTADPPDPFPAHPGPWYWASFRTAKTTALQRIEAPYARFLKEVARAPFGEALTNTERACGPEQAEKLRAALPGWIEHSIQSSWWIGPQGVRLSQ